VYKNRVLKTYNIDITLRLRRKEANEQLLQMSKGREFQIVVGAATEKLLEPKHVRTRGTDNRLVSDECNVRDGM